jgi:threonine dehydratase
VHPFDDPYVIAGAATATLELLEDEPDLERLYVPCSGGGLIAGAVLAARAADSPVEVIGVQPEGSDGIVRSLAVASRSRSPRCARSPTGSPPRGPAPTTSRVLREAQVRVLLVDDDAILDAMRTLVTTLRVVSSRRPRPGWPDCCATRDATGPAALLLSGSNVRWQLLRDVLAG